MPRKLYNFKKEKTTGEETHFSPHQLQPAGDYDILVNGQMFMSPYTDFIPLSYLLSVDGFGGMYNPIGDVLRDTWRLSISPDKLKAFNNKWSGKIFTIFPTQHLEENSKGTKERTVAEIKKWLKRDAICNLNALEIDSTSDRQRILSSFENDETLRFRQQTYSGSISPYSLYLRERGGTRPHMLAVVLPENFLYLKYHLLVHNTIPLDKVIILINKELDRGDYENPPFKKLYRELLLKIARSSCQVWKVPQEFIEESCFMDTYRLKSTNIMERKREIEGVIQEFYQTFGGAASAQPVGNREQSIGDRDLVMDMGAGRVRWESVGGDQGVHIRGIQPDEQAFISTMERAARVENQPQQYHPDVPRSSAVWTNTGTGTYQYNIIGAHTPTIVGSGASVLSTGTSVAHHPLPTGQILNAQPIGDHPPFVDPPTHDDEEASNWEPDEWSDGEDYDRDADRHRAQETAAEQRREDGEVGGGEDINYYESDSPF